MGYLVSAFDLIGATIVFLVGGLFSVQICKFFATSQRRAVALYFWHTIFCLVYFYYVADAGGDALGYYKRSLIGDFDFAWGTNAVTAITAVFSSILGLSLLGTFLVFNMFGNLGLLAFDASLQRAVAGKRRPLRKLATLIVFLPSVSFWSAGIGKDSISFMAAGLALWAAQNLRQRVWLMVLSVSLMLIVRPHVGAVMVTAIALAMAIQPRVSIFQRVAVGGLAMVAASSVVPLALSYSGLNTEPGVAEITDYVEARQGYNMTGGGAIDISEMSFPAKMFAYLFRPLPLEAHSIPALAASLDNVILLLLACTGGWQLLKRRRAIGTANRAFLWIYSITTWIILASTTANLGISVRQKWMFAPMLIYLLISLIGKKKVAYAGTQCLSR